MDGLPPQALMNRMLTGYWISQALYVVAKLGIADLLADGPRSSEDLAAATNTHAPSLYRLLRAAASVGVFAEEGERRFSLTPLAECLRSDVPGSQRGLAIMNGEEHYRSWGELLYSVQTGKPSFDHLYGMPCFDYLSRNPEPAAVFDEAMVGIHGRETAAMLEAYDFSDIGTLADIGGGNGSLLASVLQKYPSLRGILFDLDGVTGRAAERLRAAGLADRCEIKSGSFFESVPAGADAYLMRHIIHDWDDERATTILKNVHRAMQPESRLLLVEMIIPSGNEPSFGKLLDLTMLVLPGGKERTEAEYRQLYADCGFELTRIVPTDSEISVLEGRRT